MSEGGKEVQFETALKRLEKVVEELEDGALSLEEALKKYEEGVRMADVCSKRLTEAEKRVEVLMKSGAGKFKTTPLNEVDGEETGKNKKKK